MALWRGPTLLNLHTWESPEVPSAFGQMSLYNDCLLSSVSKHCVCRLGGVTTVNLWSVLRSVNNATQ